MSTQDDPSRGELEQRLRTAEERLAVILAAGRTGVWEWTPSGGVHWDDRCYSLWDHPEGEPPSYEVFLARVHPSDVANVRKAVEQALDPSMAGTYEATYRIRLRAGGERWCLSKGQCSFEEGRPRRFVGTVIDVTEREIERERALASARRADAWARLNADLVKATREAQIFRALEARLAAALDLEGVDVQLADDTRPSRNDGYPPGRTPPFDRIAHLLGSDFARARHVALDGNELVLAPLVSEGRVTGAVVGLLSRDARPSDEELGFFGSSADLAAVALTNLRVAERHRAMLGAMREAVLLSSRTGTVVYVNAAFEEIFGFTIAETIGRTLGEVLVPFDGRELHELPPLGGNPHNVSCYRAKDGRQVWASLTESPIRDGERSTGRLTVLQDVTESRKLDERLRQAQSLESLALLAGGIAHDFSNLLVGVLGNTGLARKALPEGSAALAHLDDIENAAKRAGELTRHLLAYSGKGRFVVEPVDLRSLVRDMVLLLATRTGRGTSLKYADGTEIEPVLGDASQLRQVLMNVITNALEATEERGSKVTVRTRSLVLGTSDVEDTTLGAELTPGRYVSLEVEDDGHGMDPTTRARIFDPFFTTRFTGRGLGLAAVLGIVRSHKGAVRVRSAAGEGTNFEILLPVASGTPAPKPASRESIAAYRGVGTVLVVDDEAVVRNVVKRTLERAGFEVVLAADGVEGVEQFAKHKDIVRLVFLDVTMPRMTGEEAFEQIRQLDPSVPVLFSSGYSEYASTSTVLGSAGVSFLAKPFGTAELLDSIRAALE